MQWSDGSSYLHKFPVLSSPARAALLDTPALQIPNAGYRQTKHQQLNPSGPGNLVNKMGRSPNAGLKWRPRSKFEDAAHLGSPRLPAGF